MEEKVAYMLKLIDEDGDSFAKRAEMYYRKRPELINFVEESYRAYRALAERYDHISGELQNVNNTLATVFPEQVQFSIDEEEEEEESTRNQNGHKIPKGLDEGQKENIPKVPKLPDIDTKGPPSFLSPKKKFQSKKSNVSTSTGVNKSESLEEIDTLQKRILTLQTEKEFVKSSYESSLSKYWEIENQITEMHEKASSLQDEFGEGTVIEDGEARKLMASTALKSCQETLEQLQEKQEKSLEEAKVENQRIHNAHKKLENLKDEFLSESNNLKKMEKEVLNLKKERLELESIQEKIKEHFDMNSNTSLTVTELVEKIDELVHKVISFETAISSQTGLIKRLRSETDKLQAHLESLERDRDTFIKDSNNFSEKLRELDEELSRIRDLNRIVKDQNNNLQTHLFEASCNLNHLFKKLNCMTPDEEVEIACSLQEEGILLNVELEKELKEQEETPSDDTVKPKQLKAGVVEEKDEKTDLSISVKDKKDTVEPQEEALEDGDILNWKELFLNGLEEREKILLMEYTSILRDYKEAKKKLSEVDKNNRDSLFEVMVQLKELESSNLIKDEEIQSLRHKLSLLQTGGDEQLQTNMIQSEESQPERPHENEGSTSQFKPIAALSEEIHCTKEEAEVGEIKMIFLNEPHNVSTIEEKFRIDIDQLLEENLKFWLRFSSSFQQIKKFQSTFQDLQADILKLKENKVQAGISPTEQSLRSDARPIYKHLREIQTELTVWLEQNALLRDELQCRFSSLCNIQEEISGVSNTCSASGNFNFSRYQAAKFQGEVLNMQQENNKVAYELQAGLDHVRGVQSEVEKTLSRLDEEFKLSDPKNNTPLMHSSTRIRVPLRSFLFGAKQKKQKQSIFSCMSPALHKQYRGLKAGFPT